MSRERFASLEARIPARITSALARGREISERRRLSHEAGRVDMEAVPVDQEITLMVHPQFVERECLDTKVFNQAVTRQWVEDPNPREDAWSPPHSRIGPSS